MWCGGQVAVITEGVPCTTQPGPPFVLAARELNRRVSLPVRPLNAGTLRFTGVTIRTCQVITTHHMDR